jgi:hypothetical protein
MKTMYKINVKVIYVLSQYINIICKPVAYLGFIFLGVGCILTIAITTVP